MANSRGLRHRVVLSSGRVLVIEEDPFTLHVAIENEHLPGEIDTYLCTIDDRGILVMPNSGDAPGYITQGLVIPQA